MDTIVKHHIESRVANANETDSQKGNQSSTFLFSSKHRSIKTSGILEVIQTPANESTEMGINALQQAIEKAWQKARSLGQDNPIVVGAIPFDLTRPSNLIVPESYEDMPKLAFSDFKAVADAELESLQAVSLPDEKNFKAMVETAIQTFKKGEIDKAVLSRVLDVELSENLDANKVLNNLVVQNPTAFHFRVPLLNDANEGLAEFSKEKLSKEKLSGGCLIGASPELLVRKQDNVIMSNPLAGSAKRVTDVEQDKAISQALLASEKDNYEHRLVVDSMREVLEEICQSMDIPAQPSLMNTATMWHLSTQISALLADPTMTALDVACRLHPTPAMCGSPTDAARDLIHQLEPHDRGLFSGLVGWCDSKGNGEWAVTIRCGTVTGQRIRLFAGAGIVADSDPAAEWSETRAKLNTMLNAFGLSQSVRESIA